VVEYQDKVNHETPDKPAPNCVQQFLLADEFYSTTPTGKRDLFILMQHKVHLFKSWSTNARLLTITEETSLYISFSLQNIQGQHRQYDDTFNLIY